MDQVKSETIHEQDNAHEESEELVEEQKTQQEEEVTLSENEQKIISLEAQVADLNSRLLRVQADYDNFRRRTRTEKEAASKYRAQSLIEELLPVLDNFDRALGVKVENEEAKSLIQGIEMVYRQLNDALKNEGLATIESVGQTFDPYYHQAVMQVESEEHESNEILEELQKGYQLKDRVIRPAMVKVNQ